MVEISPEEFMRALAYARAVKKARAKEDFYDQLIGRLGEIVFRHEARRALPHKNVGDLNWIAMPKHVGDTGIDLRVNGWKIDVKTPAASMQLKWPDCKKADLFPKVRFEKACLQELAARYKNPALSKPIGLLDDPILKVEGEVVGWIGIGSAEQLIGDSSAVASRVDDELASSNSLWILLKGKAGPDITLADQEWRKGCEIVPVKAARSRRVAPKPVPVLLPPRRVPRRASAAAV